MAAAGWIGVASLLTLASTCWGIGYPEVGNRLYLLGSDLDTAVEIVADSDEPAKRPEQRYLRDPVRKPLTQDTPPPSSEITPSSAQQLSVRPRPPKNVVRLAPTVITGRFRSPRISFPPMPLPLAGPDIRAP